MRFIFNFRKWVFNFYPNLHLKFPTKFLLIMLFQNKTVLLGQGVMNWTPKCWQNSVSQIPVASYHQTSHSGPLRKWSQKLCSKEGKLFQTKWLVAKWWLQRSRWCAHFTTLDTADIKGIANTITPKKTVKNPIAKIRCAPKGIQKNVDMDTSAVKC